MIHKDITKPGLIMEFKSIRANSKYTLEGSIGKAITEVNKKLYDTELKTSGVKNIIKLALVFKGSGIMKKQNNKNVLDTKTFAFVMCTCYYLFRIIM